MSVVLAMLHGERAVVSTLAGGGNGTRGTFADGNGTNAGFWFPYGVAVDASGNVFVADQNNQRIRKVTADGGTRGSTPFPLHPALLLCGQALCSRRKRVARSFVWMLSLLFSALSVCIFSFFPLHRCFINRKMHECDSDIDLAV
jgi:hypothetical protein